MTFRYSSYTEKTDPHRYVFTTIPCPMCKATTQIEVQGPDLFRYNQGAFIQDAFPYLSPPQRERLITGICPSCFNRFIPEEE